MKKHISMKELSRRYENIFVIPYGAAYELLADRVPAFYNAGVYGWNFDAYTFGADGFSDVVIITGYRNTRGERVPAAFLDKYRDAVREKTDAARERFPGVPNVAAHVREFILASFLADLRARAW